MAKFEGIVFGPVAFKLVHGRNTDLKQAKKIGVNEKTRR